MTVLVDTGVWIRYLTGNPDYLHRVKRLILEQEVLGHELVFGELLMGDPGGRLLLLSDYHLMRWVPTVTHSEVVQLVKSKRLHGRGIGWIDAHLLASALVEDLPFWTADPRLRSVAEELGIAYS